MQAGVPQPDIPIEGLRSTLLCRQSICHGANGCPWRVHERRRTSPWRYCCCEEKCSASIGDIVVARVDGDFTVKYLMKDKRGYHLKPANDEFDDIRPIGDPDFVWSSLSEALESIEGRALWLLTVVSNGLSKHGTRHGKPRYRLGVSIVTLNSWQCACRPWEIAGYENGFQLTLLPNRLEEPIRRKIPTVQLLVNSMSDVFHEDVPSRLHREDLRYDRKTPLL